jgi:hypothetical protein
VRAVTVQPEGAPSVLSSSWAAASSSGFVDAAALA